MGYVSPGKSDMELLFGVLGGGSVSGQSGTLIKEQLNQLVGELNNAKNTNERKLRFTVDTANSKVEFRKKLTTIVNDIGSTNNFEVKITKIDASSAITQLRDDINDALKMLKVDTGLDVSINADGSKSAIKQIAADAEEAIEKSARLKASIEEIKSTKKSVDKSYNAAKGILGGESATGDELTRLEEMRAAYVDMNTLLGKIEAKQKSGFAVDTADIDKLRNAVAEARRAIDKALTPEAKTVSEADGLTKRLEVLNEACKGTSDVNNLIKQANENLSDKTGIADNKKALDDLAADYKKLKGIIQGLNATKESDKIKEKVNDIKKAEELLSDITNNAKILGSRLTEKSDPDGYNAALTKTYKLLANVEKGEKNWTKAREGVSSVDYGKLEGYEKGLRALIDDLEGGKISADEFSKRFNTLNSQFNASSAAIKAAGENTKTLGERFGDLAEKFSKWLTVSQVIMFLVRQVKKMITTVIELDDAMTELKKVTDETDAAYEKFFKNASKRAKELGATLKDTINATASFARLGYDITDASALADAAVIYNNVGDEIESIDDASQSIISTMQAFGVETQNVMTIVDKFNEVGKLLPKSIVICWAKALLVAISVKSQRWSRPRKDLVFVK